MEGIIAAFITSSLTLIGVIITNMRNSQGIESKLATSQAVTDAKLDRVAEDVKRLNNFAERLPVLENKVENLSHRVDALEEK